VNASFEPDAIVIHPEVHVGIAVAIEGGLIVPVLHNADTLGLREIRTTSEALAEAARKGALTGGAIGAGAGQLASLYGSSSCGLGTAAAAGWLASTLAGAAGGAAIGGVTGGVRGARKEAGVTEEDAHVYAEGVKRGGALVSVRADEANLARAESILDGAGGVRASDRGQMYRGEGWSGRFDPGVESSTTGTTGMGLR
jgi:hypothetical protein